MGKQIWLPFRCEKFWLGRQSTSARKSVQTLGEGEGSPKATRRGWRMPSFFGGKSRGAFGQPAFFLALPPSLLEKRFL